MDLTTIWRAAHIDCRCRLDNLDPSGRHWYGEPEPLRILRSNTLIFYGMNTIHVGQFILETHGASIPHSILSFGSISIVLTKISWRIQCAKSSLMNETPILALAKWSALAATRCAFNSEYNLESFCSEVEALLRRMPDAKPRDWVKHIRAKSEVYRF